MDGTTGQALTTSQLCLVKVSPAQDQNTPLQASSQAGESVQGLTTLRE